MYPPGTHGGILVLRLADQSLPAAKAALERLLNEVDLADLGGCVAVYRDDELRARRPTKD